MSKSSLTNVTILNNHYSSRNGNKIDKITIHHMAGNLSVETCGNVFKNREASSNYGIGTDGRVGCYVEEEYRAWSTTNPANDRRAINIEVANDGGAPDWHVSDTALEKCIELCVDICKRNGISRLNYTGDSNGNLTRHNMFMATTCPGPYLQSKFPYIADEVNRRLGDDPGPTPTGDPQIRYIQETLNNHYHINLEVNGILDAETKKGLVIALQNEDNWQYNANLKVDGIMGPQTANKSPVVRKYADGWITWTIQCMLYCKGFNPGFLDGKYKDKTEIALKNYQKSVGLKDDGEVGYNTYMKLYN